MLKTALSYSHQLLAEVLAPGDWAIDATAGNGNDTLFMAQLVGDTGKIFAFDIQPEAIENTKKKLQTASVKGDVELFQTGHENIAALIPASAPIKAGVFNLGYLPKGDKAIITLPETTLKAVEAVLARLLPFGRLVIVSYYGHTGGPLELNAVEDYCRQLSQERFSVIQYRFINQRNAPPVLFCVERKG